MSDSAQWSTGNTLRIATDLDRPKHLVNLSNRLMLLSRVAALLTAAIGALVLAGWVFRWSTAVQLHGSLPPMYPNTALSFTVGGIAAYTALSPWRSIRLIGLSGFLAIASYAAATLGLHIVEAGSTFLDSALWPADSFIAATTPVPGRPVVETCVSLICIGVAGAMSAAGLWPRLTQALALGTVSVGLAAILGYVIGVNRRELGLSFVIVGMALHTAIGLTALGLAVMLAKPTVGLFASLTLSGPSAQLGRRLIAVVVIAPIALTAASAALARLTPDARLAQSVAAIGQILALGLLVILPLGAAERVEAAARDALRSARRLSEEAGEEHLVLATIARELLDVPAAPPGWELGFRQTAAFAALPGDSCQVLTSDDGRFLVAVIDVAGHGTAPAMQAMRIRTELAALWTAQQPLTTISDVLNKSVTAMRTVVTALLIEFDPASGHYQFLNAGHPAAIHLSGGSIVRWGNTRPLFGVDAVSSVDKGVIDDDSMLVVFTDGVSEARSDDLGLLGDAMVEAAVRRHSALGVQAVADACMDAALAHSNARLRDDALVLVLRRV